MKNQTMIGDVTKIVSYISGLCCMINKDFEYRRKLGDAVWGNEVSWLNFHDWESERVVFKILLPTLPYVHINDCGKPK